MEKPSTLSFLVILVISLSVTGVFIFFEKPSVTGYQTNTCIPTVRTCNYEYVFQHYSNCDGENIEYCQYGCFDGKCSKPPGPQPPTSNTTNTTQPPVPSPDSCQNKCGQKAGNCWCDSSCVNYGDCCSDYQQFCEASAPQPTPSPAPSPTPSINSCLNKCGQDAGSCWCDSSCVNYGDCCSDYKQLCTTSAPQPTPSPAPSPSPAPTPVPTPTPSPLPSASCENKCSKNAGNCWCDTACKSYGDCCADYNAFCG